MGGTASKNNGTSSKKGSKVNKSAASSDKSTRIKNKKKRPQATSSKKSSGGKRKHKRLRSSASASKSEGSGTYNNSVRGRNSSKKASILKDGGGGGHATIPSRRSVTISEKDNGHDVTTLQQDVANITLLSSDSGQCSGDGSEDLILGLVGGQPHPHPHRQPLQHHHHQLMTTSIGKGGSISSSDENDDDDNDGDSSSDVSCPFCSCNDVGHAAFDDADGLFGNGGGLGGPFEGQPLYCTKGSICSRRSRATVLSRNVRGRRKKPRPSTQQKSIATAIKGQNASVPSTIEYGSNKTSTTSAMMVAFAGMVTKKAKNHLVGNHASLPSAAGSNSG